MRVSATPSGMVNSTWSLSPRDGRKHGMARCGHGWVPGCVRGPGRAGAPSAKGRWGRSLSTGSSGGRRRMRWPRCWALCRTSAPALGLARVVDDTATSLEHAAGREGRQGPRLVVRKRRGAPRSRLRSSSTRKDRRRQARSHPVTEDPGSPEGCSQPSSPPLCGGVMTDWHYDGTLRAAFLPRD